MRALLLLLVSAALHAEIRTELLFGPDSPAGRYKHAACITTLQNGDLFLVFYSGAAEYAPDTAIYASRLRAGESRWSEPRRIARDAFRPLGNPVVWQSPDGQMWLFYCVRFGDTWSTSRIAVKLSDDGGQSWSDAALMLPGTGWMVRSKPIAVQSGDFLLPIYEEVGAERDRVSAETSSLFLRFDASGKTWTPTTRLRSKYGNLQPAVVEFAPGRLLAYSRRGGSYSGRERDGWLIALRSIDDGRTWIVTPDRRFPNPNSAADLIRLQSGRLLLLFNNSFSQRTPLTASLSNDGGATWPWQRDLASGPGAFAYPSATQEPSGLIRVVYTSDDRTTLRLATFRESDLGAP
jgi:predicted neuraminidase